jgi:hypothetical protein
MLYLSYTPRAPLNEFVERIWLVCAQSPRKVERAFRFHARRFQPLRFSSLMRLL